jgi:Sulfotransferase family
MRWARGAARVALPRHRRWHRILRSLTLEPEELPLPIRSPPAGDFMICGSPRSGTTLLAALLYQPPAVVTVAEPWDSMRMAPADLFASLRDEIRSGSLRRGRLDVGALLDAGVVSERRDGELSHSVDVAPGYLLGVKLPAFWRYLELLPDTRFLVCLRHPVEVIASYERKGGPLREGVDSDSAINRRMNDHLRSTVRDRAVRRVLLFDYINSRVLPHLSRPNVFAVRYERWFTEPQALLDELGNFLGVDVSSPRARIRSPEAGRRPGERHADLVRHHCTTAEALGYRWDRVPSTAGRT